MGKTLDRVCSVNGLHIWRSGMSKGLESGRKMMERNIFPKVTFRL